MIDNVSETTPENQGVGKKRVGVEKTVLQGHTAMRMVPQRWQLRVSVYEVTSTAIVCDGTALSYELTSDWRLG
ncbi:hypothetical protein Y032_0083g1667 [Ancylostoma ceylanicum]|nr:hypothetical protein Y032_0083g1667 [Ancylostoma ceylanicum]